MLSYNLQVKMLWFSLFNLHPFIFLHVYCCIRLQVLYWIDMKRGNNSVLFLILVVVLWFPLHLSWCWLWACCKLFLLCWNMPHISLVFLVFYHEVLHFSRAVSINNEMIMWNYLSWVCLCGTIYVLIFVLKIAILFLGWRLLDCCRWSFQCVLRSYFIEYICIYIHKGIWSSILFLC